MKTAQNVLICLAIGLVIFGAGRCSRELKPEIVREFYTDTLMIRDTIRDTLLVPQKVYLARIDTIYMHIPGDTVRVAFEVPIEQKEYETEDYRAVVEGFRPTLVSMELYPKIHYITNTEIRTVNRKKRWAVGLQAGYGLTPKGPQPYIGVGVNYNFFQF